MVHSARYILGMEIIRVKFSPLDTCETSVVAMRYTFADADGFPLSQPEQGKASFGTLTSKYFVSRAHGAG
jgi:hypothetical protein